MKNRGSQRVQFGVVFCAMCIVGVTNAQSISLHLAAGGDAAGARSAQYEQVRKRLARGWNTWDVHSVATQVLLPEGLAIHVGMKHNSSLNGDAFLRDALIGRLDKDAEKVTPGPHAWDCSYTSADYEWKGHKWRVESAHDGEDLVMLVTPLSETSKDALPPTLVVSIGFLWNLRTGLVTAGGNGPIVTTGSSKATVQVDCTCSENVRPPGAIVPIDVPYFATDLTAPVGISTQEFDVAHVGSGRLPPRKLEQIRAAIARAKAAYEKSISDAGANGRFWMRSRRRWGGTRFMSPRRGG